VVTISSRGGDRDLVLKTGLSQMVAYGASKAAVNMIVAKFAITLQTEGFIVFALSPGMVNTSATAATKRG
jgi:NAD(P)-dependent dehydrogenase (short-subunit alcohol dehydrogenase family)